MQLRERPGLAGSTGVPLAFLGALGLQASQAFRASKTARPITMARGMAIFATGARGPKGERVGKREAERLSFLHGLAGFLWPREGVTRTAAGCGHDLAACQVSGQQSCPVPPSQLCAARDCGCYDPQQKQGPQWLAPPAAHAGPAGVSVPRRSPRPPSPVRPGDPARRAQRCFSIAPMRGLYSVRKGGRTGCSCCCSHRAFRAFGVGVGPGRSMFGKPGSHSSSGPVSWLCI